MRLAAICLLAIPAFSGTSVVVGSGTVTANNISGSPFNRFGSYSFRMEGRLHNWASGDIQAVGIAQLYVRSITTDASPSTSTTINFTGDTTSGDPLGVSGCCHPGDDMTYRIQRDLTKQNCPQFALGCYTLEFWNVATGQYGSAIKEILRTNSDWTTLGAPVAQISPGVDVAWLEWYSGVVQIGRGSSYCGKSPAGPCQPDLTDSQTGDLASYKFENNLNDSSKHKDNLSGAPVSYAATPTYPPLCNAGAQQTFRVGSTGTLSGYGLSRDGVTANASLAWAQTTGPPVTIAAQNTANPTLSGFQPTNIPNGPPSYIFQLTATDASSQSTACTVKDGAVATDANDIVITHSPLVDQLVHRQLRWGSPNQPWPWYDDRAMAAANLELDHVYGMRGCTSLDFNVCYFQVWWKKFGQGTASVSDGSATLTGSGTSFLSAFNCAAGAAPANFAMVAIEYMGSSPPTNHYRMFHVAACTDDTHVVLDQPWHAVLGTATGNYAPEYAGAAYQWGLNSNAQFPANFYDNVAAYYVMYLRTGLDDFLTAFRRFADEWWEQPTMDQGECFGNINGPIPGTSWCQGFAWRAHSMLGVVLRALDKGDPPPNGMWAGMRYLWDYSVWSLGVNHYWDQKVGEREAANMLNEVALCAQFDPAFVGPSNGQSCQQELDLLLQNDSQYWSDPKFGGLYALSAPNYLSGATAQVSGAQFTTAINVTNGSKTVACVDGNSGACNWTPGQFNTPLPQLWVFNPGYNPTTQAGYPESNQIGDHNAAGDPISYPIASIDDAHHLTLANPYPGPTSTGKQYGIALAGGSGYVIPGFYIQPYMEGIAGDSLDRVAKALTASGDGADAATARNFSTAASVWIRNYAVDASLGGVWYLRGSLSCPISNTPHDGNCNNAADAPTERILNAETALAVQDEYLALGTPAAKASADAMLNAMWAKPGTCAGDPACAPDGSYVNCMDDGGYCLTFSPGAAPWKWFGQFFGASFAPGWAAARLSNPPAPPAGPAITAWSPRSVYAGGGGFSLSVTGANFTSGAVVQWNGTALPTTYAGPSRLTAAVNAGLAAAAGSASITVVSAGSTSPAAAVNISAAASGVSFGNQRVSAQPPSSSGCSAPPAMTSFLTANGAVYLYFEANVPSGTSLTSDWVTPNGTSAYPNRFAANSPCYSSSLAIGVMPANLLGSWQARVFADGSLLFSVPFTIGATPAVPRPLLGAVKNAASYAAGIVSPGEIVVLTGSGLGPAQLVQSDSSATPLATLLGGTVVQFNGVSAPILYTSTGQVSAVAPYELTGNSAQVTVTYQGLMSDPLQITVASSVPGLFTVDSSGAGEVTAINQDGSFNSGSNPAAPSSVVTLFATGEGETTPPGMDGVVAGSTLPQPVLPVQVAFENVTVTPAYAGAAPTEIAGLMQINVQIPPGISGAAVPVVVTLGGTYASPPGTTIAVADTAAKSGLSAIH